MRMTAANILTLSRLLLVPVFLALFFAGERGWSLAVFCIAGATDLVDGTVARMLKQHSQGGALLDPIADKLLVQSCFISLALMGVLPWWFAALALARDVMIVCGIFYLERIKVALPYRPTMVSKFATLLQICVAVLGLVSIWRPDYAVAGVAVGRVLILTMYVTALLIAASGARYVQMGLGILREHRAHHG
ncbi:MAG: CDP-alcohol phosphatidyltransferase family protein [bacterium]